MKLILCILIALVVSPSAAYAEGTLSVVGTLSTFADLAKAVGRERVETKYIAPPRFNAHFIEPKPSDVLKVKRADLFIHSGTDLEAWRLPLVDAAARAEVRPGGTRELGLAAGIRFLEVPDRQPSRAEGDIHSGGNPHYWLDPRNARVMAASIAAKLAELDPAHRDEYEANLEVFKARLDEKMSDWSRALAPYRELELVGYHNEWVYLMDFAGMKTARFIEPKPGIPPSAKHLSELAEYIRRNNVRGLIQATFYPRDAADHLAAETGIRVSLLCQNTGEVAESGDYIALLEYNIHGLLGVLRNE